MPCGPSRVAISSDPAALLSELGVAILGKTNAEYLRNSARDSLHS